MKRILLAACVLVVLLPACSRRARGQPSPVPLPTVVPSRAVLEDERTTVRFAITDVEVPIYEDVIAAFEEENPDLDVQIVSVNEVLGLGALGSTQVPEDANQRLVAAADVVKTGISRQMVQQGLVRDLSPFLEADPNFQAADFFPGALENYQWEGGTWALPTAINFRLIFYNKDAFDEAGVPYPEAGWSWDDLLAKARAVTVRDGDGVTRWGFVCPAELAYRLVESRVGALASYSGEPPTPRFDETEVIEAVRWYADLHLREQVMPYFGPQQPSDTPALSHEEALIDKGQAAMWPDFALLWWYRKLQGDVGVAPFPQDTPDARTTPAWTASVAMSAGTTQPDAAWRWMVFLTRQAIEGVGQGAQQLPARGSAAEASGYWGRLDEELATALRYAWEHGYVAREPVAYNAFQEALHMVMREEKAVADALAEAQALAEAELLAELPGQAGATPAPTFVVAPAEKETPIATQASKITFIPGLGSFNLEPYRRLAEQFHQEHPDIIVEVKMLDITGAGGAAPDLASMAQSADCFQWYPGFQEPKNRQAILGLEPFLEADLAFNTDDFFPQLFEQFTYQGQIWGLPADVTPFVIEYNKDLFDAAGVGYPTLGWTWEDFLEAAMTLTTGEGEDKQYGFVAEVFESSDLLFMLERLGANLVNEEDDPPAFTFTDPSVIEALRWYASLSTEHGVKPIFITDLTKLVGASASYLEREGLINQGRAAMWTSSGTTAALFGPRSNLNIGVAPLPARADGTSRASLVTASGYFISATTENHLACWQWITFLTGQAEAVQGFPARRSVAESEAYRQRVGADKADAYMASIMDVAEPSALQVISDEDWLGGALLWLYQAYGKVLDGKAGVEEALDEAQRLADDYRACVISGDDFSQAAWEACLKQTDPNLPSFLLSGSE